MKSSNLTNPKRIKKVLSYLSNLKFGICAVIIDKREIFSNSPLQFPKTFIKFIHKQLFLRLFQTNQSILVVADKVGWPSFMKGFEAYVRKQIMPDLFVKSDFKPLDSKEDDLIQVADLVAGLIRRAATNFTKENKEYLRIIQNQISVLIDWPPKLPYFGDPVLKSDGGPKDRLIREVGVVQALRYLDEHPDPDTEIERDKFYTVQYLLYWFRYINPERYIPTKVFLQHIGQMPHAIPVTAHYFRSKIIASLRDQGVLIASHRHGLKLPYGVDDLIRHVEHSRGMIEPMVSRLKRYREILLLASSGKLDILNDPRYDVIRRYSFRQQIRH